MKAFDELPYLSGIRDALPKVLGPIATDLNAEGNYYYEDKSGIGYHGDSERKIVIGFREEFDSSLQLENAELFGTYFN